MESSSKIDSVQKCLLKWRAERDYKRAAATFTKYIVKTIQGDKRLEKISDGWDWERIRLEVFKFAYLAVLVSEVQGNPESSWSSLRWVLTMAENIKEEIIPRLTKFDGRVYFYLDAGFKGIRKSSKKI